MVNSNIGRTFAAIVCSILFSATFVLGAVGPAQIGATLAAPATATHLTA
ncbi:MAG: hypothetical protein M3R64_05800 [Pseudomonadota bacterium]|nr:hypothetical protein [Pseudomonadota bacterium]